uniref:AlNc14C39G3351 protein n=1 Tax=Albugo laibachii Nc14 TaxID=890382 RepID=F0W984_9STRA|nr:AlNc14C39G3351 [Albugo laibachii Nc14]CCA18343.1 AlNc14C49G3876 [Albugo laibachii Nc14]|eukprot:CCA18343.1 AlNc14C49G3876 [Albugo laibachii Nc14]
MRTYLRYSITIMRGLKPVIENGSAQSAFYFYAKVYSSVHVRRTCNFAFCRLYRFYRMGAQTRHLMSNELCLEKLIGR